MTESDVQFYRMADIARIAGCSKSGVYCQIKDGTFPKQIKWGQRAVRWPANEVQAVIDARKAGKSNDEVRELVRQLHEKRTAGSAAVGAA